MQVIVQGNNGHVDPAVRIIAERKLQRLERLERDAARADVHFEEERNPRISGRHVCVVTLHLRRGAITARAAASRPETAVERVHQKLRHQLERIKDGRPLHAGGRRAGRRGRTRS